jgi:hypothetical protein
MKVKSPLDYFRVKDNNDDIKDIICERLVKNYDGKSIHIAGLNFGGFQLGNFGIEPKLLQTVSHALMLLDASQYDLCNSIKNMKDKDSQEKYVKLMTDDKLAAQRIFRALAGLLINPESIQMQDAVKDTLLSTLASRESRAADIENSNLLTKIKQQISSTTADHATPKENAIEIGSTSFKEKINDLRQSYSQISNNDDVRSSTKIATIQDPNLKQELIGIRNAIIALSNEYTTSLINGLNIVEFWGKMGAVLQQLTANTRYRKVIGTSDAEALDRIMIKIGGRVSEFKEADDLGDRREANIAKKEVTLYFGQVFRRMDDIYSSIQITP